MEPERYEELQKFLTSAAEKTRAWPDGCLEKGKRTNYRRFAQGFSLGKGGELLKQIGSHVDPVRVVCGEGEKKRVLEAIHGHDVGGGHMGVNKTYVKVSERYWWKKINEDVRDYIAACEKCQKHNALRKVHGELHPVPFADRPFALWGMDLVGPLPETPRGKKYIMTITNYLTRWAKGFAIPDKTATTVCECLGELICDCGVPERIISDQGREFVNQVNDELCSDLQIKRSLCSAYHPQSNGLTERFNQTLERVLSKMANDEQDNWDTKLKWALFSYNTSRQSSSKVSPFFLMYGVTARIPIEVDDLADDDDSLVWEHSGTAEFQDSVERRMKVLQQLPAIQRMGKENIETAQAKQKGIYDAKHKGTTFQVGDKVLYYNARNASRKGGKMEAKYLGPKKIAEVLSNGTVRLEGMKSLTSSHFLKHFKQVKDDDNDADIVDDDADIVDDDADIVDLGQTPMRKKAAIVALRYVFRPPTEAWMKTSCARLGLTYVGCAHPFGRVSGVIFKYSSRPARLLNTIKGDGNCLFRALCWWISGSQDDHAVLRRAAVDKMLEKNMDDYVRESNMAQLNTWGGIDEVMAISELLDNVPIITFLRTGKKADVQAVPSDVKNRTDDNYFGMYLNWHQSHYEVVLSVKV